MIRPVNIGLSPNLEADDVWLALKTLVIGGKKDATREIEAWFESYLGSSFKAVAFNSGRSAQWAIIKALGLTSEDEVLIQDFTCVAVPNSVYWAGSKTIDVKIKPGTYNMDSEDLKKKITKNSKVVIVQHTFGQSADLDEISTVCKKNNLVLIEDCAHALGASYKQKLLGTVGDVSFFSLGRDKVVSSVFGGIAITKNPQLYEKLRKIEQELPENNYWWVVQQLLHPILTSFFLPVYNLGLGKAALWLSQRLHLLSMAVYSQEKRGLRPSCFPAKYSKALATLGLNQLPKLERFNAHRKIIAQIYFKELADTDLKLPPKSEGDIYLRFTVDSPRCRELYLRAKLERKWVLGDWYQMETHFLNLPTYPSFLKSDALELCNQLKIWLKHKK